VLDHNTRKYDSVACRRECGDPSSQSWSEWRRECGVKRLCKRDKLTEFEAFLLYVRSQLRGICQECNIPYPPATNKDGKPRGAAEINIVAEFYAKHLYDQGGFVRPDGFVLTEMTGAKLLEVAHQLMGKKSVSVRTVQRWMRRSNLDRVKPGQKYTIDQLQPIILVLQKTRRRKSGKTQVMKKS
jgi:hypothetical protein